MAALSPSDGAGAFCTLSMAALSPSECAGSHCAGETSLTFHVGDVTELGEETNSPCARVEDLDAISREGAAPFSATSCVESLTNDFGSKTIGYFAGFSLLCNSIIGPGMPGLPNVFVEAGWLIPTICIVVIYSMTTMSCSMFGELMREVPGNDHFRGRAEYTTIVKHFLGRRWYLASLIGLNCALQSLNIASIIQSAQVTDTAIAAIFGKTCSLNLTPFKNFWTDDNGQEHYVNHSDDFFSCFDVNHSQGNAWGCHVVISIGYVLVLLMAVPCSMWNLDDNVAIQVVCLILGVLFMTAWAIISMVSYSSMEHDGLSSLKAINSSPALGSQAGVLGSILFNWNVLTTVPSWINEKKPNISVNKTLWCCTTFCMTMYLFISLAGATAFADVLQGPVTGTCARQLRDPAFNCPNDLMQVMTRGHLVEAAWRQGVVMNVLIQFSVYMFPIVAEVSGIVVFSIIIKYNLVENGFSKTFSNVFGIALPWMVSLPVLYMPNIVAQFINFTSLIFLTFANFVVPLAMYAILQGREMREGPPQDEGVASKADEGAIAPSAEDEGVPAKVDEGAIAPSAEDHGEASKVDEGAIASSAEDASFPETDTSAEEPHLPKSLFYRGFLAITTSTEDDGAPAKADEGAIATSAEDASFPETDTSAEEPHLPRSLFYLGFLAIATSAEDEVEALKVGEVQAVTSGEEKPRDEGDDWKVEDSIATSGNEKNQDYGEAPKVGEEQAGTSCEEKHKDEGEALKADEGTLANSGEETNQDDVSPLGVHQHHAFPLSWGISPMTKAVLAVSMSVLLTLGSLVAIVFSVQEGKYTINRQVCALVGS